MEFQLTYPTLLEQVTLNYCKHELCQQETSEIFRIYLYLQTYEIIMKRFKDTINATGIIFFSISHFIFHCRCVVNGNLVRTKYFSCRLLSTSLLLVKPCTQGRKETETKEKGFIETL